MVFSSDYPFSIFKETWFLYKGSYQNDLPRPSSPPLLIPHTATQTVSVSLSDSCKGRVRSITALWALKRLGHCQCRTTAWLWLLGILRSITECHHLSSRSIWVIMCDHMWLCDIKYHNVWSHVSSYLMCHHVSSYVITCVIICHHGRGHHVSSCLMCHLTSGSPEWTEQDHLPLVTLSLRRDNLKHICVTLPTILMFVYYQK